MKRYIIFSIITATGFLFHGCSGDNNASSGGDHAHEAPHGHAHGEKELIVELNDTQIENAGIETGNFTKVSMGEVVEANGELDLPPENIAAITPPHEGFVEEVPYLVGDYIKKGTPVVTLKHPSYFKIQEAYLKTRNNKEYLAKELERQKELDRESINAKKKLQKIESEYRSVAAKEASLRKQLEYMGIRPGRLSEDKLQSVIAVRAPFSGYVTELNIHKGMYVMPETEMYEMVNIDHMHLEINVFEEDIYKIKKGQSIDFMVPGIGEKWYKGEVHLVGKSFDEEKKTILIHGHLSDEHPEFIRGLYVEARINTGEERVAALPDEAVVKDKGKEYIFIQTEANHFRAIEVETGMNARGYVKTMPLSALPEHEGIVTKGSFYLISELRKGDAGHGHSH